MDLDDHWATRIDCGRSGHQPKGVSGLHQSVLDAQSQRSARRCGRACRSIGHLINIQPSDVTAHSLCTGGATALSHAKVDPTEMQPVGRWRSWAMIRHLHKTAPDAGSCANCMLAGGQFVTQEHHHLPADIPSTLTANPPNSTCPPSDAMGVDSTFHDQHSNRDSFA